MRGDCDFFNIFHDAREADHQKIHHHARIDAAAEHGDAVFFRDPVNSRANSGSCAAGKAISSAVEMTFSLFSNKYLIFGKDVFV